MAEPALPLVRPTKRCLDDLGLTFPRVETPLHQLAHPLVKRAQKTPEELASGGAERIRSLDDRVWLKCKTGAMRAAVTRISVADASHYETLVNAREAWWWIGAAGERRDDSASDFYKVIAAEARRKGQGLVGVDTSFLLPQCIDFKRLKAEAATETVVHIRRVVRELIARSLGDGKLWTAELTGHELTVGVRTRDGDAYLAICAEGFPDARMIAVILDSVPRMRVDDWMAEPGGAMGIKPQPGQIIYSGMIPAEAQAAILDECDSLE